VFGSGIDEKQTPAAYFCGVDVLLQQLTGGDMKARSSVADDVTTADKKTDKPRLQ